jgi:hypothetical protein
MNMRSLIEKISSLEEDTSEVIAGAKKRVGEVKRICRDLDSLVSKYWEAASKKLSSEDTSVPYRQQSSARSIDDLYVLLGAIKVELERGIAEDGRRLSIEDTVKKAMVR